MVLVFHSDEAKRNWEIKSALYSIELSDIQQISVCRHPDQQYKLDI